MMNNELKNSIEFMTSAEIAKALATKIKTIRKKGFKTQRLFAEHIGMSYSTYARFEKTGQVSFQGFIEILRGLNRVEELATLFDSEQEIIQW